MTDRPLTVSVRARIGPPRPGGILIERHLPEVRVREALGHCKGVLVCAPAGFGKTSLLVRVTAARAAEAPMAWISADADDDLPRFLQALFVALDACDLPWRVAPEAIVHQAGLPGGSVMAADALLETLADAQVRSGLLVLEDLHRVRDAAVFEWLDRMLTNLPAPWTLLMSSRTEPPLALPRLRLHGELCDVRAEDLRLTDREAHALAAATPGLQHRDEDVELFWQRTQGWAAGLRLALQTGDTRRVLDRHAFDYLASEVLDQMTPELRTFLLRCSVLPELSDARCARVTLDPAAAIRLDDVERLGLFVTAVDDAPRTLRLHDLFRDCLRERLERERADELPELWRRAAEDEPDPVRRVTYLLRADDLAAAERALVAAVPGMLLEGAGSGIRRLVAQFPERWQTASPELDFVSGQCAWPELDWVTLQRTMQRAGEGFRRQGQVARARQATAFEALALLNIGRLAEAGERLEWLSVASDDVATEAFIALVHYWHSGASGRIEAPARHLARMLDLLERETSPEVWLQCLPHFIFLGHPGVGDQFDRYADHALVIAGDGHPQLRAAAQTLKAWRLLWSARLDEAEQTLIAAEEDVRWLGRPNNLHHPITVVWGVIHALRAERALRDADVAALAAVDNDEERRRTWQGIYLYQVSRWYLVADDWPVVGALRRQLNEKPVAFEWPYVAVARTALNALWALHEGQPERACALLEPVLGDADRYDITATRGNVRGTLALAWLRRGRPREAWAALAPAIAMSRVPGEALALVLCGATLLEELAEGEWATEAPPADLAWLRHLAALARSLRREGEAGGRASPGDSVPEALSPRECEVLARLAAGESNKEIAREFGLSPHTVKRHVANILDKLDVRSRGQAAAWWHVHQAATLPIQ